ncbi:hypothetical protein [Actinosynnema sp. NPDC020468]|uniref:hypothetical protein n=1 Tax=Actinosynnema sp. NPDC020468 TaxID=3154488 RepID=UPI0033E58C1E
MFHPRNVPVEVFAAIVVGAASALAFVLEGLVRWQADGDPGWIRFPVIVAVLELLAVAALLTRARAARLGATVVFVLVGLIHLLATLNDGPVWVRVLSGVLSAAHVFGLVLLNTRPSLEHFGGSR